jgi:hypothetical protein
MSYDLYVACRKELPRLSSFEELADELEGDDWAVASFGSITFNVLEPEPAELDWVPAQWRGQVRSVVLFNGRSGDFDHWDTIHSVAQTLAELTHGAVYDPQADADEAVWLPADVAEFDQRFEAAVAKAREGDAAALHALVKEVGSQSRDLTLGLRAANRLLDLARKDPDAVAVCEALASLARGPMRIEFERWDAGFAAFILEADKKMTASAPNLHALAEDFRAAKLEEWARHNRPTYENVGHWIKEWSAATRSGQLVLAVWLSSIRRDPSRTDDPKRETRALIVQALEQAILDSGSEPAVLRELAKALIVADDYELLTREMEMRALANRLPSDAFAELRSKLQFRADQEERIRILREKSQSDEGETF